jgi:hypothetical protein
MSEDIMQIAMTFSAVVAGMAFSLAVALLAEELIFGQVIRRFFVRTDQSTTKRVHDRWRGGRHRSGDRL